MFAKPRAPGQERRQPEEQLYIGVDLHSRFFQACAVSQTGERHWEDRFLRTASGFEAFRGRCQSAGHRGSGSERADMAFRGHDDAERGAGRGRGCLSDAAKGGICSQDGSPRCAPPGRRASAGKRRRDLHPAARRSRVARVVPASTNLGPHEAGADPAAAGGVVTAGHRRSRAAPDPETARGARDLARCPRAQGRPWPSCARCWAMCMSSWSSQTPPSRQEVAQDPVTQALMTIRGIAGALARRSNRRSAASSDSPARRN